MEAWHGRGHFGAQYKGRQPDFDVERGLSYVSSQHAEITRSDSGELFVRLLSTGHGLFLDLP